MHPQHQLLLQLSLAFVWVYTGVLCLAVLPLDETALLASRVGLGDTIARWTVIGTSAFEIVLGVLVAVGVWRRAVAVVQLVLIVAFTLLITVGLPEFWLHPFGPITKNVVLVAAVYVVGFARVNGNLSGYLVSDGRHP